jgi:hypothetical protein
LTAFFAAFPIDMLPQSRYIFIQMMTLPNPNKERAMPARGRQNGKYQGAKWLTRERRLALYIRDGLACVWCGQGIEDGIQLSLDHITPKSHGGDDTNKNLMTACKRCNSSRGNRSVEDFSIAVAAYLNHGISAEKILNHLADCIDRPVDIRAAKALIAARGGYSKALRG